VERGFDRRPQRRADQIVTDKFATCFASGVARGEAVEYCDEKF
jgi:hypothetical protein